MIWLNTLLAAVPSIPGPNQEAVDKAANSITESGVFGAAFIIMLAIFVGIIIYLLARLRGQEKASVKERDVQETRHENEREQMRTEFATEVERRTVEWNERFDKYSTLLDKQYITIGEIQEKRVELAQDTISASKDIHHEIRRSNEKQDKMLDLLESAIGGDDDSSGD